MQDPRQTPSQAPKAPQTPPVEFVDAIKQGVVVADSSQNVADKLNQEDTSDSFLALNNKPQPHSQAQAETPQEVNKTIYTLGERNTGISYFDNKKELTLLDAYIAKQLGLKTDRLVHKLDVKSDNHHRVDSLSKIADISKKDTFYADTFMRSLMTAIANDKSSFSGMLSQGARNFLQGSFGIGEASEQKQINAVIQAIAMKQAGGSSQLSPTRFDMARKEYYQAQSIDQKAQVIALHLKEVRDSLVQNAKRAQASGAKEQMQNDLAKIQEIDTFLALLGKDDKNELANFMRQKSSYTPMPQTPAQAWRDPMAED